MINEDVKDRELTVLRAARDKFDTKDCAIVTWNSSYETEDDVKIMLVRW